MFEKETNDAILGRMMKEVSSQRDKREGSIIFDALAPAAIEFMLLYQKLEWYIRQSFGDTAERDYLIRLALERGLVPKVATFAVVKGIFSPATLNVEIGERFSVESVNYAVVEKQSAGVYLLKCETAGTIGNHSSGQLIPIGYIEGFESAYLSEVTIPGEDEEGTEVFRERYLTSFNSNAFGGNIDDYKEKVRKIDGIGGIKVYPIWQGGGTVRVVFVTSEFKPPTVEFINQVQTIVDPIPNQGNGLGTAPIGHIVTVQGARDSQINIELNLAFVSGITFDDLKGAVERVIDEYFAELNRTWEQTQVATTEQYSNSGLIVRISQIESRLLDVPEILDIQDTKLNGSTANLVLGLDELAVRGELIG